MPIALVLGFLFLLFCVLFALWLDKMFGGLDYKTDAETARQIISLIQGQNLSAGKFYDLGSSRGGLAIQIAKALPNWEVYGIDDSGLRTWWAKVRAIFLKNIEFERDDIFATDLSFANVVYVYLPQELMSKLESKLRQELKSETRIITYKVSFPDWEPKQVIGKFFIYEQD